MANTKGPKNFIFFERRAFNIVTLLSDGQGGFNMWRTQVSMLMSRHNFVSIVVGLVFETVRVLAL
jgi:hypothetical protein